MPGGDLFSAARGFLSTAISNIITHLFHHFTHRSISVTSLRHFYQFYIRRRRAAACRHPAFKYHRQTAPPTSMEQRLPQTATPSSAIALPDATASKRAAVERFCSFFGI